MNTLLQWFVTSSVLILAVLALRRLLGGRISPRVKYALWGVVLLRLLVPFQIPMPNLPTAADLTPEPTSLTQTTIPILPSSYSMEEVEAGQAPNLYLNDQGQVHTANSTGTVKPSADGQRAVFSPVWLSPAQLLLGVWGAGAVILTLVLLGSNLRFSAKLRRRRTSLDLDDCPLPVYTVESLPSPCLFGLFRPCIYLTPQLTLDSPTRAHVLAHELTHYRQKDHIWSALRCLALALHWYNPLVWLAVALSKRDGELSCDAGAVKALGDEARIPYGRTLVSLVAQRSLRPEDLLSCSTSMVEGKGSIQERIAQLVKHPKAKKTALAAAVVLLALAAVFTFGGSQNQPEDVSQDGDASYWDQVQSAQSIQYSPPLYSSAAFPDAIADADLLEEAKTLLSQAKAPDSSTLDADWTEPLFSASTIALVNPDNSMSRYYLCTLDGRDYLVSPAQLDAEKYTPVAVFSGDAGAVETALADLARQQSERNASTWRVEYPEFKNQLTELFLSVEECVLLNQSEDYDMEEWLTKYTSFYEIVHGVPWWLEDTPEGWYARAMDAGSWYTIVIPDSIVSQVQAICEEQARYPEQDFFYSVLYHADTVRVPVEPGTWDQIKDQETVSALANLFLENLTVPTSNWQPERVSAKDQYPFTFITPGSQWVEFYLSETEDGYLLALGRSDGVWESALPVLARISKDTMQQITQTVETWRETQPGSASYPANVDTLRTMANLQASDIQTITFVGAPAVDSWVQSLDKTALAELIRQASKQPLLASSEYPNDEAGLDYALWSLELRLSSGQTLTLMAGREKNVVSLTETARLTNCAELYDLIREGVDSGQQIAVTDQALLDTMEQVLEEELKKARTLPETSDLGAVYQSAQLTSLHRLASFDNLVDGSTVNIYGYDFGFVLDDLFHAPWAGGPWVDGQLRYHPDMGYQHLITVEQNGKVAQYVTTTSDFPLDPESYASHTQSQLSLGEYAALLLGLKG